MTEQWDQDQLRYWFDGWDHYAQTLLLDYHQVPLEERDSQRKVCLDCNNTGHVWWEPFHECSKCTAATSFRANAPRMEYVKRKQERRSLSENKM